MGSSMSRCQGGLRYLFFRLEAALAQSTSYSVSADGYTVVFFNVLFDVDGCFEPLR